LRIPREGGTPLTLPDRTRPGPELSLPLAEYVDPNDPSNNLTGAIVELRGFVGRMHTYAASEHNICQAELLPTHEVLSMEPRPGDRTEVVMLLTDDHWLQDALFQGQRIKHKQRSPGRIMVLGQRIDISDWSEVFPYSELPVRHPRQDMYYIYSVSLIP
ncbi:MAG TPA: hypothetical protein QGH10_11075, partial [Armatimonadota bacterium]|nr:hypothetical protein [Armatimonadota bacterium]